MQVFFRKIFPKKKKSLNVEAFFFYTFACPILLSEQQPHDYYNNRKRGKPGVAASVHDILDIH